MPKDMPRSPPRPRCTETERPHSHRNRHRHRHRPGLLSLDTALALGLLGLATMGTLAAAQALAAHLAEARTRLAFTRIEAALGRSVLATGALPCPDRPDDGDGRADTTACGGSGLVPWRTLGLARAQVVDGWGALVVYRPDPALGPGAEAPTPGFAPLDCAPQAQALQRLDLGIALRAGDGRASPSEVAAPAYVLISPGPNRKGAVMPAPGTATGLRIQPAEDATAAERANRAQAPDPTVVWTEADPAEPQGADGAPFDDRVFWRSLGVVLFAAGCRMDGPGH